MTTKTAPNPVQQRVLDDLLAVGQRRPPGETALAERLERLLVEGTAPAADLVPAADRGLFISKSRLDALACDGRYLDLLHTPFTGTEASLRGTLVHTALEVDQAGGRARPVEEVIAYAWRRIGEGASQQSQTLASLPGVRADALRADVLRLLLDFRDQFPLLPSAWAVRAEPALRVRLHDGRVVLQGRPDLAIGRPTHDRRRLMLLDYKTGARQPARHRADLRFYALLATLKHRVAPFRVATLYLDEAAWDVEEPTGELLEQAAHELVEQINRAAELAFATPADADLQLRPSAACGWCARASGCPALRGSGTIRALPAA